MVPPVPLVRVSGTERSANMPSVFKLSNCRKMSDNDSSAALLKQFDIDGYLIAVLISIKYIAVIKLAPDAGHHWSRNA